MNPSQLGQVKQHIKNLLRRNHKLDKEADDDFEIATADQMLDTFDANYRQYNACPWRYCRDLTAGRWYWHYEYYAGIGH